ncbi:MAG: MBL fold metallo-hydrolase [Actinomycetaceae bacterium]|nr:MBL fold metallo-hydrolase [Actinomycetaceae bacterium]
MRLKKYEGFWQATLLPRLFPVNVYFIRENDGLTLIDTAVPIAARHILRCAQTIGAPIKRIALTHAHYDHAGGVDHLKRAVPDIELIASTREAPLLAGDIAPLPGEYSVNGELPGNYQAIESQPDRLVDNGEEVGELTVISTPGHTPGHISFFHEKTGALFAGDAFQTRATIAVAGDRVPLFPFVAMATWDKHRAYRSAEILADLPVRYLATGHGEVLTDPKNAMHAALERAKKNF